MFNIDAVIKILNFFIVCGSGPAASIVARGRGPSIGPGAAGGGCGPGGGSPRPAALVKGSRRQPPTREKKLHHIF